MATLQRCCTHCPGIRTPPGWQGAHDCCQQNYVTGNLRLSSLEKHVPLDHEQCKRQSSEKTPTNHEDDDTMSCYDKFAFAKRLHADNLRHQSLPDRVGDSVFKNVQSAKQFADHPSIKHRPPSHHDEHGRECPLSQAKQRYGPVLGCKKPETKMDLAICWGTPINATYEPRRPTHIDGSEGGLAPAIFALVQHTPNASGASLRSVDSAKLHNEQRNCCTCLSNRKDGEQAWCNKIEQREADIKCKSAHCQHACKCVNSGSISKERNLQEPLRSRKCYACAQRASRMDDPRQIRSAVGAALGLQKNKVYEERNGLPAKLVVPRPRTPFAKRSFCIDSLAPPFSVVTGCRDADYPEHWRLMSTYQQSYRNPRKKKYTVLR